MCFLLLISTGCKKKETVRYGYIDFQKVPIPLPVDGLPVPSPHVYPISNVSSILKPLPPRTIFVEQEKLRGKYINEWIASRRKEALLNIVRDIEHTKDIELAKLEHDNQVLIDSNKRTALEKAYDQARDIFLKYAEPIGEVQYKLAVLVGFPDKDPLSQRVTTPRTPSDAKRIEEAKKLRLQLRTLDTKFWIDFNNVLLAIKSKYEVETNQLKSKMEELQKAAHIVAEKQAETAIETIPFTAYKQHRKLSVELPKVPAVKVNIGAEVPSINVIQGPSKLFVEPLGRIRDEAQIWARLNGYRLTNNTSMGKDLTEQFIKWRRNYEFNTRKNR